MKHIRIRTWVKVLFFIILISTLVFLYGRYIEPKMFKINEYNIIDSKIPSSFYGLKIAHISDIHYKVTTDKKDLEKIIKKINLTKPDIVIFSGDLFDSSILYTEEDYNDLKELLSSITYSIGKYAITGENDIDSSWEDIMESSNFNNLNDSFELIYSEGIDPILLIGISSNYKSNHIKDTIDSIYDKVNADYKYSILVLHEPDFINYIEYSKFDLILSGHSFNGLVKLPFIGGIVKNNYSKIYYDEYYRLGNTKMYISSGIGSNKYKFRLLNSPSINLYRLRNK